MASSDQVFLDEELFNETSGSGFTSFDHNWKEQFDTFLKYGAGSNLGSREFFSDVAELIDCSALLRVRVDSAKLNTHIVDRTHPVLVRAALQKSYDQQYLVFCH